MPDEQAADAHGEIPASPAEERPAPASSPGRYRVGIGGLAAAACTINGVCAVLAYFSASHWGLDLLSHFRPQYAIVLLVGVMVQAALRHWRTLVVTALAFGVAAIPLIPCYVGDWGEAPVIKKSGPLEPIRVMSINVHTANEDTAAVIRLIQDEQADIILLQETSQHWLDALDYGLPGQYPHRLQLARSDNFGMAVWSRYPMHGDVIHHDHLAVPIIDAVVQGPGGPLRVANIHPTPPAFSAQSHRARDHYLEIVGQLLSERERGPETPQAVVVGGDFNASRWSWIMDDFQQRSGLTLASNGHGVMPTWPNSNRLFYIAIDHQLFSQNTVERVDCRLGPDVGSDHRPVIADYRY